MRPSRITHGGGSLRAASRGEFLTWRPRAGGDGGGGPPAPLVRRFLKSIPVRDATAAGRSPERAEPSERAGGRAEGGVRARVRTRVRGRALTTRRSPPAAPRPPAADSRERRRRWAAIVTRGQDAYFQNAGDEVREQTLTKETYSVNTAMAPIVKRMILEVKNNIVGCL